MARQEGGGLFGFETHTPSVGQTYVPNDLPYAPTAPSAGRMGARETMRRFDSGGSALGVGARPGCLPSLYPGHAISSLYSQHSHSTATRHGRG